MVEKDVVSWSSMVNGYCKNGRFSEAREFFNVMGEKKNEVTWCAMINGYLKMGCFKDGFNLFLQMRRGGEVGLEPMVVTAIFEACGRFGRFEEGFQLHGLVSHMGFEFDVFMCNSIITMYSRFSCMNAARNMFNTMNRKDLVSWNSLINGYVQAGELEEAYQLFEKMEAKDLVSWTTMITGFSNKGLTENCIDLFNRMPERDDIAWTALISGFVNNGDHEKAVYWFIQMLRNAVRPNPLTLSGVLSASAGLAILNQGLQVHALVFKMNMELDLSVQNALISMYSKCGSLEDAYRNIQIHQCTQHCFL
ncbi:Pentatricopeptide repeat-containing protein [Forsythia ovata]|uniref:Pentatricopeptide repeat-containing protein n=1 Tax=Forsythia ovata TaxID=205694 RepID=A0ABD1S9V5_9LAMI